MVTHGLKLMVAMGLYVRVHIGL
jgi:hypothetical protein